MTPSARLQSVLELLIEIAATPRPADALTSAYFRARRYIGSKDRAFVSATLYDVLRHHARLGWWLERAGFAPDEATNHEAACRARLLAYLLLVDAKALTAVTDLFSGGKFAPRMIDDKERWFLRKIEAEIDKCRNGEQSPAVPLPSGEGLGAGGKSGLSQISDIALDGDRNPAPNPSPKGRGTPPVSRHVSRPIASDITHPDMPDEVTGECPAWAAAGMKRRFGDAFLRELQALLKPAPLDLRVNLLKADRASMLTAIAEAGLKATPCPISPLGIRVEERPSLNTLPMLKDGQIEIQDEGSQMVAFLVDAKPGMRVVDFCAGAGGKTLAIAVAMKNKGKIIACDVLEKRLKRSTERFRRAGLHNIEVKPLTTENDPWVKRHKASFDRVLVDAPCSGTGTWRRNPDQRWKELGPGLAGLLPLQASILASASRLVQPGGRLVYATCSLLSEENEHQVEAFLAAHPDFHLVKISEVLTGMVPPCPDPYLALTPAQHNTDGFFGAVMERAKKVEGEDEKKAEEIE